jgi:spore maturation protein CgeB
MRIVILGLTITSSWGNGHATTFRHLVRGLQERGHDILFLERDVPWYASQRDLPRPPWCDTRLYGSVEELQDVYADEVRAADLVVVGSYVPEGIAVGRWGTRRARGVTAFYDIDTPVTLAALARGGCEYLSEDLIPHYRLYLSFTGGPTLERLRREYGSPDPRPLYCSVDPETYRPLEREPVFDLGYLGTYSVDRQPTLERSLLEPARRWPAGRFAVAGPQYPREIDWPANVERREHVAPSDHAAFYGDQRFTLNVTRADMSAAGWSPSVRLFEAAACGVPIISDRWNGLDDFFEQGSEILTTSSAEETLQILQHCPEEERLAIAERARRRVLAGHTGSRRAEELETYVAESLASAAKQTA